jgi:hypothetical protein
LNRLIAVADQDGNELLAHLLEIALMEAEFVAAARTG